MGNRKAQRQGAGWWARKFATVTHRRQPAERVRYPIEENYELGEGA